MYLVVDRPVPRFGVHLIIFGFQTTVSLKKRKKERKKKYLAILKKTFFLININEIFSVSYSDHNNMRLQ